MARRKRQKSNFIGLSQLSKLIWKTSHTSIWEGKSRKFLMTGPGNVVTGANLKIDLKKTFLCQRKKQKELDH